MLGPPSLPSRRMVATLFLPTGITGLSVDGGASIIHHTYARDHGVIRMVMIVVLIALLASCVLLGAYYHAQRGTTFGRAIVLGATILYVALTLASVPQGAFAGYPTIVALACLLFALLPGRPHPATEAHIPPLGASA
ncbi:MAG: hypothetical protein ACHQ4H_08385 [Ktedonobacterales bacterium]